MTQHQQRDGGGAAGHGAGMQLQQFAVEDDVAGLLRQPVARLAHGARHIAVAMRFPAVHNDFVRRVGA